MGPSEHEISDEVICSIRLIERKTGRVVSVGDNEPATGSPFLPCNNFFSADDHVDNRAAISSFTGNFQACFSTNFELHPDCKLDEHDHAMYFMDMTANIGQDEQLLWCIECEIKIGDFDHDDDAPKPFVLEDFQTAIRHTLWKW
jgi:hypothetical protein